MPQCPIAGDATGGPLVLVMSTDITVNHTMPKTTFVGLQGARKTTLSTMRMRPFNPQRERCMNEVTCVSVQRLLLRL